MVIAPKIKGKGGGAGRVIRFLNYDGMIYLNCICSQKGQIRFQARKPLHNTIIDSLVDNGAQLWRPGCRDIFDVSNSQENRW